MAITHAELRELKEGKYVMIDNEPCKIVSISHSKPGKHGSAKIRIEAIGVFDDQKRSLIGSVDQRVEVPIVERRAAQVLAKLKEDLVQLMDLESYEVFELEVPKDFRGEVVEGSNVLYLEFEGRRRLLQA